MRSKDAKTNEKEKAAMATDANKEKYDERMLKNTGKIQRSTMPKMMIMTLQRRIQRSKRRQAGKHHRKLHLPQEQSHLFLKMMTKTRKNSMMMIPFV